MIIVVLTTLSSVDATQTNQTSDNDAIGNLETDSQTLNENNGDFSTLSNEINASAETKSLKLTKDYLFDPQNDEDFSNGITIAIDELIIDGQGHTIDANKKARIFNIQSDNVILKNIKILNGNAASHGGAICWKGFNGTLSSCIFMDSSSPNSGGAILFEKDATIENSRFIGNSAFFGGGVNFDGKGHVNNCTFENNYARYLGGGIYNFGQIEIFNSRFEDNEAGDGGGIYLESPGIIEKSIFERNNAIGYGGAITNEDKVVINDSQFLENTGKFAGAIYFKGSGHVQHSTFSENSADLGGAVSIYSNNIDIANSEFKYNSAEQGPSLYINGKNIKIENITFTNNQTDFESEICMISKNTTFNNLTFQNITQPSKKNETINPDSEKKDDSAPKPKTKKKTSITAKSKKFKLKTKAKKYSVILKAGKNILKSKKLYLKLNGKTYTAKTDKKGKAIFKIKIRKKGKFKGIITFKGDATYSSSKKTIYIKIK